VLGMDHGSRGEQLLDQLLGQEFFFNEHLPHGVLLSEILGRDGRRAILADAGDQRSDKGEAPFDPVGAAL